MAQLMNIILDWYIKMHGYSLPPLLPFPSVREWLKHVRVVCSLVSNVKKCLM